ncbi:MAG: universal stress protein, partial [Pseudomonadota bacterium]|nr:universal stress protein [Pseudomonadota bacterium]
FGMAGLSADLTVLADPKLALLTVALVAIASIGKFGGAFLGGRIAGMSLKEATAVGSAMNARGSTEVIVASIGLSMNILSHNLFTMIVTMAVLTTLAMPSMLRWALGRLPINEADKQRVDRELLDERGFVSRLERLLLLVDDSPVGTFTAYIAGLIGGGSGMPTTLLHFSAAQQKSASPGSGPERVSKEVKKGAARSAKVVSQAEDTPIDKVHLTARTEHETNSETIAAEARKGYGLLLVGLERALTDKSTFSDTLKDATSGFDGPLCLVLNGAKSTGKMPTLRADATILVPVNGTEVARRGADFALALARPHRARVRVLYVSQTRKGKRPSSVSHLREEAVLKDIAELADRYGVTVETAIRSSATPDKAIVREMDKGIAVMVMGVTQRPGDDMFFGNTATAILAASNCPVVLLASDRARNPNTA